LFRPEKAKSLGTPERVQHMRTFPIFEVGFVRRIVRVGFAFDLYVSFDGWLRQSMDNIAGRESGLTSFRCFTRENRANRHMRQGK